MHFSYLPPEVVVKVLCYLDVLHRCRLQQVCKWLYRVTQGSVPQGLLHYYVPDTFEETLNYPFTSGGKLCNVVSRSLCDNNHYQLTDSLLATVGDMYFRAWCNRRVQLTNTLKPCKGLSLQKRTQWCELNTTHLWQYTSRTNKVSWLHIKSFPESQPSLFTALLSSVRKHLNKLLVQYVSPDYLLQHTLRSVHCPKLHYLTFKNVTWTVVCTIPQGVSHVKISGVHFTSEAAFQKLLQVPLSVKHVHLENLTCSEKDSGLVIAENLTALSCLQSLVFCDINLTDDLVNNVQRDVPQVQQLSLLYTNLDDGFLRTVILNRQALVTLDLTGNELESLSLRSIAQHMESPLCVLKTLNVSSNYISTSHVAEFVHSLHRNKTLLYLDMGDNYVGYQGYTELRTYLVSGSCILKCLDLSGNQVCTGDKEEETWLPYDICALLGRCKSLQRLNMSRNIFPPHSKRRLFEQHYLKSYGVRVKL